MWEVFLQLKRLLEPFGIKRFCTDGWGAYQRHLPAQKHEVGKRKTQRIERKHLQLRTRIKRLARRTICFSKSEVMHDKRDWIVHQSLRVWTINLETINKSTTLPTNLPDWGVAAQLALEAFLPQLVLFLLLLEIQRLRPLARSQGLDIQIACCKI